MFKGIDVGEEVLNSFGKLSSSELLRRYGFAESRLTNPYNTAEISVQELMRVACFLRNRLKRDLKRNLCLLKRRGCVPRDGWFRIRDGRAVPVSLKLALGELLKAGATQMRTSARTSDRRLFTSEPDLDDVLHFIACYKLEKLKRSCMKAVTSSNARQEAAASVRSDEIASWMHVKQRFESSADWNDPIKE